MIRVYVLIWSNTSTHNWDTWETPAKPQLSGMRKLSLKDRSQKSSSCPTQFSIHCFAETLRKVPCATKLDNIHHNAEWKHDHVSLKVYPSSVTAWPGLSKSIPIISDNMTLSICKITYCQCNMTMSLWKYTHHQWQHDLVSLQDYLLSKQHDLVSLKVYPSSVTAWPCLFPIIHGRVDLFQHNHITAIFHKVRFSGVKLTVLLTSDKNTYMQFNKQSHQVPVVP